MVHVARRMTVLRPLLKLRIGQGAVQLPPPPAPQLTRIVLQYPSVKPEEVGQIDDSVLAATKGAYQFKKDFLPRIKYHNPSVKIEVGHYPKSQPRLTLYFEGTDREALRAIESPKSRRANVAGQSKLAAGKFIDAEAKSSEEAEQAEQRQTENETEEAHPQKQPTPATPLEQNRTPNNATAHQVTNPARRKAPTSTVKVKKPINTSASAPQSVKSPSPIYERSVYYSLQGKQAWEILTWFKHRTGGVPQVPSEADKQLAVQLRINAKKAANDRILSAKAQAIRDREQAAIRQVREAAERNAAEAAAAASPA